MPNLREVTQFNIPIVLFFFKRTEKTLEVLSRISEIRPKKLFLISDFGRNDEEVALVSECRAKVDAFISWPCDVIRDYAEVNRGVYASIGLGAKWVLTQVDSAIFLEDDNLPELSFFAFCEEMLERYRDDTRILWICGTNYLREFEPSDGSSYVFTRHMLPCGWASWTHKFPKFYDGDLELWDDPYIKQRVRSEYSNRALLKQDIGCWNRERKRIVTRNRPNSWDYQMSFTQRAHGLYAIVPRYNQISNIGVDEHSTHGGTSFSNVMTSRFCGIPTKTMQFPLIHPKIVQTDLVFENAIGNVILLPKRYRLLGMINTLLKRILFINQDDSLSKTFCARIIRFFRM